MIVERRPYAVDRVLRLFPAAMIGREYTRVSAATG